MYYKAVMQCSAPYGVSTSAAPSHSPTNCAGQQFKKSAGPIYCDNIAHTCLHPHHPEYRKKKDPKSDLNYVQCTWPGLYTALYRCLMFFLYTQTWNSFVSFYFPRTWFSTSLILCLQVYIHVRFKNKNCGELFVSVQSCTSTS